jgi:hypothetical protein
MAVLLLRANQIADAGVTILCVALGGLGPMDRGGHTTRPTLSTARVAAYGTRRSGGIGPGPDVIECRQLLAHEATRRMTAVRHFPPQPRQGVPDLSTLVT